MFLKYFFSNFNELNQQTTKITGLRVFISWKADGHDRDFCSSEPAISYSCSVVKTTEVRDSIEKTLLKSKRSHFFFVVVVDDEAADENR